MMHLLCSKAVFCNGNAGTAGTPQQWRGLACSLIKQKSGNTGTQLCLINNHPAPVCSRKKTPGTNQRSEKPVLERLLPLSRVPAVSEFRRGNNGGYLLFFLTQHALVVPRLENPLDDERSPRPAALSNSPWPASAKPTPADGDTL